jgi:hypothetical protein
MSSRMRDGADDFGDLEPRSFTMHTVAFFALTNDLVITDLMINAALQESYCWQSSTEGHPTFVPGLPPAWRNTGSTHSGVGGYIDG